MNPLISVITVCYNAESTIKPTLDSVRAQTFKNFEYIVVDGDSTDNTLAVIANANLNNLKLISEPDNGIYFAMNKGLHIAKGDYMIFLNAGDSFHDSGTLSLFAAAIIDNSYPGVVYGQTVLVDSSRKIIGKRHLEAPEKLVYSSFSNGMVVCHQAFCALRRLIQDYNTKYRFSADYDWCIRILQHSRRNVYIPETVIDYLSEGVTTANHKASLKERFKIMCYYYGTIPSILRHIRFAFRYLSRSLRPKANNQ